MGARYYEANTSGMNFDRFLDHFDDSTITTMKRHYWTAKQMIRSKLGKKEDEHLEASDQDLDTKLNLFRSVRDTSFNLLNHIENYQAYLLDAILVENELGKYLKERGKREKREQTKTVLTAAGRALIYNSHQRAAIRQPLVRFYQELQVFNERAIADCTQTVDAAEKARTEYRGSLLWMKKTSEELDPDTDRQMDKFREAQKAVKGNKERLDRLKGDVLQKVDLLAASRSNLLAHLLGRYYECLSVYYSNTAKAHTALAANLSVFQHYEFEILTDLIEPSKKVARKVREDSLDKEAREKAEQQPNEKEEEIGDLLKLDDEANDSLKRYLFGRDSPIEERRKETVEGEDVSPEDEEQRGDSPLGEFVGPTDSRPREEHERRSEINIGPLLPLVSTMDLNSEVPKLPPPPVSSTSSTAAAYDAHISSTNFITQDLFPLVKKKEPLSEGLADLLSLAASSSNVPSGTNAATQFINPFLGEQPSSEWDSLLSQCDQQQSMDLL